jgi:hypothetical protein
MRGPAMRTATTLIAGDRVAYRNIKVKEIKP